MQQRGRFRKSVFACNCCVPKDCKKGRIREFLKKEAAQESKDYLQGLFDALSGRKVKAKKKKIKKKKSDGTSN